MSNNNLINKQQQSMLLLEKYNDTLSNIQELQAMEKYMFENLQKLNSGENDDIVRQKEVVDKINELSNIRISLFNQLKGYYSEVADELKDSKNLVADKKVMVDMVEHELNNLKKNIQDNKQVYNTQLRKVEIGTYENLRTEAQIYIMKVISIILLITLILAIMNFYNILPSNIFSGLVIIVVGVGIIYIIRLIYDIYSRDDFNFNQYKIGTNSDIAQTQPGYETVLQHDELFFSNLGGELRTDFNQSKNYIQNQLSGLEKTGNEISNDINSGVSSLENDLTTNNNKNSSTSKNNQQQLSMSNYQ